MTVRQLRKLLEGLPDETPCNIFAKTDDGEPHYLFNESTKTAQVLVYRDGSIDLLLSTESKTFLYESSTFPCKWKHPAEGGMSYEIDEDCTIVAMDEGDADRGCTLQSARNAMGKEATDDGKAAEEAS